MDKYLNQNIGKRVKERRNALGITMAQMKEMTNISSGNMSSIENGRNLPSAQALIELSKALNCTADWILKGDCFKTKTGEIIKEDEMQLLTIYRQLSMDAQEEVVEFCEMKLKREKRDSQKMEESYNLAEEAGNMVG